MTPCVSPSCDPAATQNTDDHGENFPQSRGIRDLEGPVLSSSRGRVVGLQECNAVRATIDQVPGEVLSLIFQAACPPAVFGVDKRKDSLVKLGHSLVHIILSQVCAFWRGVVQTTPQLWTHLTLYLNFTKFNHSINLLLQFLIRSGDLPLNLAFHFSSDLAIPSNRLLCEDTDPLLLKNFSRIQGLELSSPPAGWLSKTLPPLSQLVTLSLGYNRSSQPFQLSNYPHLRHLQLTRVFAPIFPPSLCQTITTLHLATIPIDICAAALSQCPHLVDFQNRRPYYAWDKDASLWPTERTSFSNLKNFEWEILSSDDDDTTRQSALLNNIDLPSLQCLRWTHPRHLRQPFPYEHTAGGFFSNLPTTLTKITLCGIHDSILEDDYSGIVTHIRGDSNIKQITFVGCNAEFMFKVIRSLEPQPGMQLRYPELRDITIEFSLPAPLKTEHTQSILHSMVKMLEHRIRALNLRAPFSIHLERFPEFEWLLITQRVLADLKNRGFQLEIFLDSKPVPWLA